VKRAPAGHGEGRTIPVEPSLAKGVESSDRREYRRANEYLNWQMTAADYDAGPDFAGHPMRLEDVHKFIKPHLEIPRDAVVVDLATGTGHAFEHMLKEYKPKRVIGVDWASEMLKVARGKKRISHAVLADVSQIPLKTGSADFVSAIDGHAIRSVDPDTAFKEIHRILKPGMQALVTVPYTPGLVSAEEAKAFMDDDYPTRHIREAGLDIIKADIIRTRTGHEIVVLARKPGK